MNKTRLITTDPMKSDTREEEIREVWCNNVSNDAAALQKQGNSIIMFEQLTNVEETVPDFSLVSNRQRRLISSSPPDGSQSAACTQELDMEIVHEVEGILHAFRTALEVLPKVIGRIGENDKLLREKAAILDLSLIKGRDIDRVYRYVLYKLLLDVCI